MNKKFVKPIAIILAFSLISVCFASCKRGEETEDPDVTKGSVEAPSDDDLLDLDLYIDDDSAEEGTTAGEDDSAEEDTQTPTSSQNSAGTGNGTGTGSTIPVVTDEDSLPSLSQQDIVDLVKAAGYEYDAEHKVFYSVLNPWQRHFGFGDAYDELAVYANMRYTTIKIDFTYHGLLWRIQCWKGQYGVLAGGEMGVYTKEPESDSDFYECASDENLLEMQFKFYKTVADFNGKTPAFERKLQEHWWLTGFQFGYCDSKRCVMEMTLNAKDTAMADGIEKGLLAVTDDKGNANGFTRYTGSNATGANFYIRNGNTFRIIWLSAGYQNYVG